MFQKQGNPATAKQGIARSRPARGNTGSGQTVDKREIPEYPQREHPPTRRDNHANTVQTRKREKPTPHPPEQRRGKPQQAGAWTPADSRGIEPHPNNSSEPISSRTLHLAGLLSKRGETKQLTSTRSAQQEPAHHPPNAGHQTPHGRHQPQGYTPQCRPQHAPPRTVFNRFASP